MGYEAPHAYAELIEPRYAPIAHALVEAACAGIEDDVLELGAGTGLVTRLLAPAVRSLVATDAIAPMLELARATVDGPVSFAVVDYTQPLPYLDDSFDLVVSGLTLVQDDTARLREVARVLRPGGRVALSMWGRSYHELTVMSDALESIGRPRIPPPSPRRAARRLAAAGFTSVEIAELAIDNVFESVEAYLEYRRGFGRPPGASKRLYERYLRAIARRARRDEAPDGTFTLGWSQAVITGRRD